ncbi:MAG: hypothetical protein KGJ87_11260, partial [Planctomycetota bacterium]|nr:hypothetical protein [Planctomycetota bacterium]
KMTAGTNPVTKNRIGILEVMTGYSIPHIIKIRQKGTGNLEVDGASFVPSGTYLHDLEFIEGMVNRIAKNRYGNNISILRFY